MYPEIIPPAETPLAVKLKRLQDYSNAIYSLDKLLISLKKLPISKNEFLHLLLSALSNPNQAQALKLINMAIGRYQSGGEHSFADINLEYLTFKSIQTAHLDVEPIEKKSATMADLKLEEESISNEIPDWWKNVTLEWLISPKKNKSINENTQPDIIKQSLVEYIIALSAGKHDSAHWETDIEKIISALIGIRSAEDTKTNRNLLVLEIEQSKTVFMPLLFNEVKSLFEHWVQQSQKNEVSDISNETLQIILNTLNESELHTILYQSLTVSEQFTQLFLGVSRLSEIGIQTKAKLKNAISRAHKDWILNKLNLQQGEVGKAVTRIHLVSYEDLCLGFAVLNEAFSKVSTETDSTFIVWLNNISAKEVLALVDSQNPNFAKARVAFEIVWGLGNTSKKHHNDNPYYCITESEFMDVIALCAVGTTLVVDGHGASIGYWNSKSSQSAAEAITQLLAKSDGKIDKIVVQQCLSGSLCVSEDNPNLIRKSTTPQYKMLRTSKDRILYATVSAENPFKQFPTEESKKDSAKALGWCLWQQIKHSKERLPKVISITTTPALLNPEVECFAGGNMGQPADRSFHWPDTVGFGENTPRFNQVKSVTVFVPTGKVVEDCPLESLQQHSKNRDRSWRPTCEKSPPEPFDPQSLKYK